MLKFYYNTKIGELANISLNIEANSRVILQTNSTNVRASVEETELKIKALIKNFNVF